MKKAGTPNRPKALASLVIPQYGIEIVVQRVTGRIEIFIGSVHTFLERSDTQVYVDQHLVHADKAPTETVKT